MHNTTIGLDKFYIADLDEALIDSYSEEDELKKLSHLIYSRKKAFMISENYLYLLEKLGFFIFKPTEIDGELDLGHVKKFLDINKIYISYTYHYQLNEKKSIDLFLNKFPSKNLSGIQFYYVQVKSFSDGLHELNRKKWPFLIQFEDEGEVKVEFKRIKNGIEKIIYNHYSIDNTFKSYQILDDFFISEIHFCKNNQVDHLYFNLDGKVYSFFEICQYLPYLHDIGQDKIAKGDYIITKDEVTLIRMTKY